jgi:hypothetical protein
MAFLFTPFYIFFYKADGLVKKLFLRGDFPLPESAKFWRKEPTNFGKR